MDPYQLTTYSMGDFVLREYPGKGSPNKYSSYEITNVQRTDVKNMYTIRNLVTQHEYTADVTHLKPFYHAPTCVVPLNIAVKDTDEYVVEHLREEEDGHTKRAKH